MKPTVTINGILMDSLGWLRESISFPPVQSQTSTTIIPGRNSPIRFSLFNNRISYQPRTFKIVLVMSGYRDQFMNMITKASENFAGVLSKVSISEKPGLYVLGTLQLDAQYDVDIHKGTLTISCQDADAFFYHNEKTVKTASGSQTLILENDFMASVPTITCTADTTLSWSVGSDKFQKSLSAGTWTIPELELKAGKNSVSIETDGQVSFEYQEGCL